MAKYNPKADDKLTTLYPPCFYCKHLKQTGTQSLENWLCSAFQDPIPYGILARHIRHDTPAPGQENQDVYESREYDEEGPDGPGPYLISFEGIWKQKNKRPGSIAVFVTVHRESVVVALTAIDEKQGVIGDFVEEVRIDSPRLFGLTYDEWRALGDGRHEIAVPQDPK